MAGSASRGPSATPRMAHVEGFAAIAPRQHSVSPLPAIAPYRSARPSPDGVRCSASGASRHNDQRPRLCESHGRGHARPTGWVSVMELVPPRATGASGRTPDWRLPIAPPAGVGVVTPSCDDRSDLLTVPIRSGQGRRRRPGTSRSARAVGLAHCWSRRLADQTRQRRPANEGHRHRSRREGGARRE